METGKLIDNIRVTKNWLGSGVERMFKSSDSVFYHITNRLYPFGKSVEFDILFLGPLPCIRFTCIHVSHASMLISKFTCHENETGPLNVGPLRKRSLSFSFRNIYTSSVFCYDKYKKNFDIHFSKKRQE